MRYRTKAEAYILTTFPRYRGIDRQPLEALTYHEAELFTKAGTPTKANKATALLAEIAESTGREDGWISSPKEIQRVWNELRNDQQKYEIIFARSGKNLLRLRKVLYS
jgi:hypothetical protein